MEFYFSNGEESELVSINFGASELVIFSYRKTVNDKENILD
jgi:hypothetical protein